MKIKAFLMVLGVFLSLVAFSQSDEDLIRHTIHNYFNGTAYNHISQIEAAFHPEAELYLEKDGKVWKISAAAYIDLFRKNEPGVFTGRYNKILSIDLEGNLAQVKAEILVPNFNRRFIDIFIVKKVSDSLWQIVSKAANSSAMKKE